MSAQSNADLTAKFSKYRTGAHDARDKIVTETTQQKVYTAAARAMQVQCNAREAAALAELMARKAGVLSPEAVELGCAWIARTLKALEQQHPPSPRV